LSNRELQRAGVLARVKSGELALTKAAKVMRLSYRQTDPFCTYAAPAGTTKCGPNTCRARAYGEVESNFFEGP
jgi:hypothetical protein